MEVDIGLAQNRESQIVELGQWITDMNDLLQGRLDADILAGDTPKEFEVFYDLKTYETMENCRHQL